MNKIDTAIQTIMDELDGMADGHDCRVGPEDGCAGCFEIAHLQSDLSSVKKFIEDHGKYKTHQEASNNSINDPRGTSRRFNNKETKQAI